jgi:hypothetical protein
MNEPIAKALQRRTNGAKSMVPSRIRDTTEWGPAWSGLNEAKPATRTNSRGMAPSTATEQAGNLKHRSEHSDAG